MEVQIIDKNGLVIVTTSGFDPIQTHMPDYVLAKSSASGEGSWQGKSTTGEKIMAGTTLLADYGNGIGGAVRWVVSLRPVDRQIFFLSIAIISVGIIIIVFALISGLYFVRSIVRPISEVSNSARKIAMGDFNTTLQVKGKNEISELCDTINYMASELKKAEEIKNDFISSVSHELRTPLTAIRGWGETAKMTLDETDDELVHKGLDVILGETERLSGLVEELLDFSRMQTGRLTLQQQNIDLCRILNDAVSMYVELAKQQKLELIYAEPRVEHIIYGDPNRLKQVFINIIDNAVKYTEAGGQILIEHTLEEGCVIIKITDTGVGIPEADIDHVKEKFYKANKTVRGSGIGLAMADEIIKQHNGLLFIESTEGVGTTVSVALPIIEDISEE
ncbi:MAG: HAMP domain-containing histidine kinase [Clostridia bacterium]|nr:HAMP domain-containing histidine kinase [Clostridia bacterium]